MFTNDLNRDCYPARTRRWGIAIGTVTLLTVCLALVSPRTIPFCAPLLFMTAFAAFFTRATASFRSFSPGAGALTAAAFLGYALLSSLWAERPLDTLPPVLGAAVYFAGCGLIIHTMLQEKRHNIFHISEGVWIGLFAGLVYLLIEILSKQTIKLHLYNALGLSPGMLRPPSFFQWEGTRLVFIAPSDLTRNIAPVTLFLWSALLALRGTSPTGFARVTSLALFLIATAVVFLSEHETSKLALAGGAAAFAMARITPLWTERLLRVAWVTMCLAAIPISLSLHRLNLHNAPWMQETARHRIVIWNHTAEESLKSPVIGIGAGMMYGIAASEPAPPVDQKFSWKVPHAHNVYLQTWFELGMIGAALLTLVGLAILERIRRFGRRIAPYAQATFASSAIMAASSYGMWQVWFVAMYGLTVALFAIAIRANIRAETAVRG